MVKPPLRTKSIGFKVSEEEYAQLETAAQASGQTLGEWCRQMILGASDAAAHDPALAEIIGVRLLLVNVLQPMAAGEKVTPEKFNQLLDQISDGGWPRLLISPSSPTKWVPRPSRTLRRAGVGNAFASGSVTPRDSETKSPSSLRSRALARLRPKDRNDSCSNAIPRARRPSPASPDCDAYTSAFPRASWSSTR